jgi:hypothetical protein
MNGAFAHEQRDARAANRFVRSAIYKIFTKPFYYGWFEYPKAAVSGIRENMSQ